MANATFNLRNPNSKTLTPIALVLRFGNSKIKYSTGQKVKPSEFNSKLASTRPIRGNTTIALKMNDKLSEIKDVALGVLKKHLNGSAAIDPKTIRSEIDFQLHGQAEEMTFWAFFDHYIDHGRVTRGPRKGQPHKPATKRDLKASRSILKGFEDSSEGHRLTWESISHTTYDLLLEYLEQDLAYSLNSCGNQVKNLKAVLNAGFAKGYHSNLIYKSFVRPQETGPDIYLSIDELKAIKQLILPQRLDGVRDALFFLANTGPRYKEYQRLTAENLTADRLIYKSSKIEGLEVKVPLSALCCTILEKYKSGSGLPPQISRQKFSDYLKEICKLAEIVEEVDYRGKRVEKWQAVAAHTLRRSFITNLLASGMPIDQVSKIAGHKTLMQTAKYNKVKASQVADLASTHPFFTNERKINGNV